MSTRIKFCGFTEVNSAIAACELGVDFIGLIFFEKSQRNVSLTIAKEIALTVKRYNATPVAVVVAQTAEAITKLCDYCEITTVQLHGDIARAQAPALPQHLRRILAVSVSADGTPDANHLLQTAKLDPQRDWVLFDGIQPGSGQPIVTNQIKCSLPFFLAGGLNPYNVGKAIKELKPFAVDVASAIESKPGIKSFEKMRDFVHRVRF